MAIERYFDALGGPDAVFDPIPSFAQELFISFDNLEKNAKKENGKNLFLEFKKKTYDEPLMKIFNTFQIVKFPLGMVLVANENNHGRCLKFPKEGLYYFIHGFLNRSIDKVHKSDEEHKEYLNNIMKKMNEGNEAINKAFADALKIKADRLKDVILKSTTSEYYDAALKDYQPYQKQVDFPKYLKIIYEGAVNFSDGFLKLGDFFDQKLDFYELYNAFDPDTFYLLFATAYYENILSTRADGIDRNSCGYLAEYNKACEAVVREEKDYNPKVLYQLMSGKKVRFSRRQFQIQYQEFLAKYPNAKPIVLPNVSREEREKYKDIDLVEKLTKLTEEDTRINWELLPKGEGEKKDKSGLPKQDGETQTKSIEVEDVLKRIDFIENTGFIGKLKGINTFTGYYAYVYPNGNVILEKFWEDEEEIRPAVYCATYIMNIDNFVSMSKISKINLVEYIKTLPELGVKRLYHSNIANWEKNIYKEINGAYRLEDAMEFINGLKSGGDGRER